jgi:hypothetical protein
MAVSAIIFLLILVWAWYKNCNDPSTNILGELLIFTIGAIFAWGLITLISILFKRLGPFGIFVVGIIISFAAIIAIPTLNLSMTLVAGYIAFIYICFLYPFAMIMSNSVRRALLADSEKRFYIFALFGLALFVVTKIIELVV